MTLAAIFDMDGTLIDSMPGLTNLAVEVIRQYFHLNAGLARREYLRTVGVPFSEQLAAIFPGIEARPLRVVAESVYIKRKHDMTLEAPVFPTVLERLERHRRMNDCTVLVSSTHKSLVEEVVLKQFNNLFSHVYGFDGTSTKEAQINNFLAHSGYDNRTIPFVDYYGDSDEDLRIARHIGCNFFRVGHDGRIT